MSLSCVSAHAPLLRSLADPCAAACLRLLAQYMARSRAKITSCDVEVRRAAAVPASAFNYSHQSIISHCLASHKPLRQLHLAQSVQTILHRATVHGLCAWLRAIELPLMSSARAQVPPAPSAPCWYAAAVAVMDDDTTKQVLVAVAAAAAAAAASLVSRSDAALTAPCAASAVRWCARAHQLPCPLTPPSLFQWLCQVRCGAGAVACCWSGCVGKCGSG